MESAPLTLAHTHSRNAVLETRKSNPVAASEEHDLAAGEFATAAQNSTDREALRTLHLLEQHHKKLAQILRFEHEHPELATSRTLPPASDPQQQPPRLSGNPRLLRRETSSIASNLASARGILAQPRRTSPVSPTLSSQQAGTKMTDGLGRITTTSDSRLRGTQTPGQRERANRVSSQNHLPAGSPTDITSQQYVPADPGDSPSRVRRRPSADEGFQRFYSTFEGLISKLSAPLAFAGLPLGPDGTSHASSATRKSSADTRVDRHTAISDRSMSPAEPDIGQIFSRAALRAIRDSNGGMGTGSTAESFYVVPTTGGTVSYAGILTRAEKEARRNSVDEGEEDFVDARETPSSPEMLQTRSGSRGIAKGKTTSGRTTSKLTTLPPPKTLEELQMENQALKHLSDTLSKRLHMWEVNAQSSSMALQQSLKSMHNQTVPPPDRASRFASGVPSPAPAQPAEHDRRIKELEELLRRNEKELEQVSRDNEKLRNTLGRYRDRWEKLKEGAKTRRAGANSAESSARNSTAAPSAAHRDANSAATALEPQTDAGGETEQDVTSNEPDARGEHEP